MPAADLPLLIEAAQEASKIALRYWRSDQRVDMKPGDSPVSEGDYAVDAFLRERLLAARPGYGWLSEETEDSDARQDAERVFIVDPIDGTRAYVAGEETWALSLAVVESGVATAGVVYLPARDKLYAAALGQGATLNGAQMQTGARSDPKGANVLAPKPTLDPKRWSKAPPRMARHWRPSLAYRFCLVGEGRFDAVLTIRDAYEWDIAAGILIAQEAGATVTDRRGKSIRFNARTPKAAGVFAAPPGLHKALIGLYRG